MHSAEYVAGKVQEFIRDEKTRDEAIRSTAELCLGWPYVFGAVGEECKPSIRKKYYNNYLTRNAAESEQIQKKCRVLSGKSTGCAGCMYYPGSPVRCYDCRGFTRWLFGLYGVKIMGGGCTSQWNDKSNWAEKGLIRDMPADAVCCVFMKSGSKMIHTGAHVGGGRIIHCSGTVKAGKTTDKGWTHYAIPKGMEGTYVPTETKPGTLFPTLRKGSKGEYVTLLQTKLLMLGYSLGSSGADGDFGTKTAEAVRKFQADRGLTADGIAGPMTWAALEEEPVAEAFYTVRIPHLRKSDADELAARYSGATAEKE